MSADGPDAVESGRPDHPQPGDRLRVSVPGGVPVDLRVWHVPGDPDVRVDLRGRHTPVHDDLVLPLLDALTRYGCFTATADRPGTFLLDREHRPRAWERWNRAVDAAVDLLRTAQTREAFDCYVGWVLAGASESADPQVLARAEQAEMIAGVVEIAFLRNPVVGYITWLHGEDRVTVPRLRARGSAVVVTLSRSMPEGKLLGSLVLPAVVRLRSHVRERWWQAQLDRVEQLHHIAYPELAEPTEGFRRATVMRETGLASEARFWRTRELTSLSRRLLPYLRRRR